MATQTSSITSSLSKIDKLKIIRKETNEQQVQKRKISWNFCGTVEDAQGSRTGDERACNLNYFRSAVRGSKTGNTLCYSVYR